MDQKNEEIKQEKQEWVKVNLEYNLASKMEEIQDSVTKRKTAEMQLQDEPQL